MKIRLVTLTLCWLFAASPAIAQSAQELYQQGLGKQDLGDYQDAIRIYERVVREFPSNRRLVARAKVRMIDCWQRLGEAKASDLILEVIRDYKDQPDAVAEAKKLSDRNERFKRLTDKDVLVLADFVNTTGDSTFDQGLRQALRFRIEESPFLKVMDTTQMQQALQFLRRSPGERLTPQVARDICVREQEKATLEGSIATVGTTYLIVLEAVNCRTGATLARDQATARDKSGVMQALEEAAKGMRVKLGESLGTIEIEKPGRPYADGNRVTTTSLEAFEEFALGEAEFAKGSHLTAIPHYRRATELDPNFAMAFAVGSANYGNLWDTAHQKEFAARAYALVDRVTSERERLYIMAQHYAETGERSKQLETYEVLTRRYPRDAAFHSNLGELYRQTRDMQKAEREFQAAIQEAPRFWLGYANLANLYLQTERFADVRAIGDKAIAAGADSPALRLRLLRIADLHNDSVAVEKEIQWFAGNPEEYTVIPLLVNRMLTLGQPQRARELAQRGQRLVARLDFESTVSNRIRSLEAQINAFMSGTLDAFQPDGIVVTGGGTIISTAGRTPPGPVAAAPPPRAVAAAPPPGLQAAVPPPVLYARGLGLLRERKGKEAAAEFQKILDGKVLTWGPIYPFALAGVARGAAIAGDTTHAKRTYEEFLELWKDAEANIPILVEARREYAALQSGQPVVLPQTVPGYMTSRMVIAPPSGNTRRGIAGVWWSETFPAATLTFAAVETTLTGSLDIAVDASHNVPLYDGTITDGVIAFKVKSADGKHIITFTGKHTGDEIMFSRAVEVLSGGGPTMTIFGMNAPTTFTAIRVELQPAR